MEEIKIVGIDADGVTEPRNDGSRGAGLYTVPILLSRTPSAEWSRFFVEAWDNPEAFSTLHRPRIASVMANRIVLNGTTLEEVDKAHKAVLVAAVRRANEKAKEHWAEHEKEKDAKRQEGAEFRQHVKEMSEKIKFD